MPNPKTERPDVRHGSPQDLELHRKSTMAMLNGGGLSVSQVRNAVAESQQAKAEAEAMTAAEEPNPNAEMLLMYANATASFGGGIDTANYEHLRLTPQQYHDKRRQWALRQPLKVVGEDAAVLQQCSDATPNA